MTKFDKKQGRPHRKTMDLPKPREMKPVKKTKKESPRYIAQTWERSFSRWRNIGSSKYLDQAIAMMQKCRSLDKYLNRESITRVFDKESGEVVAGYKKPVPYSNPKKEEKERKETP